MGRLRGSKRNRAASGGHIFGAVCDPLLTGYRGNLFRGWKRVVIRLGEQGALFLARGGSLHPIAEANLEVESGECLAWELTRSNRTQEIRRRFLSQGLLQIGLLALARANWGVLGLRVRNRFWLQAYVHGLPVTPVTLVDAPGVSLLQALSFSPDYYPGLPFMRKDVELELAVSFPQQRESLDVRLRPNVLDIAEPPSWILDPQRIIAELLHEAGAPQP